jgi:pimeloyl-ACP methyl ester carboxylesterase
MRDVLVASVNESYEAELARITQPCVMVWGTGDRDVPREVAERAIGLMPSRPRLEMVEHCGHLVPTERPDVLVSAALELLA